MPSRTLPNLDLTGFFDLGEDGWNDEMDLNLLKLSVLVQGGVQDKLAGELVSPVNGDIIVLDEAHPTNANAVAVYDDGAWVYFTPTEGWLLYNQAQDYYEKFDGTVWAELATGGSGGIPDAPSDGNIYGRQDGTWVEIPAGGGSGGGGGSWKKLDSYDLTGLSNLTITNPDSHHIRIFARQVNQANSGRANLVMKSGGVEDTFTDTAFLNATSGGTGSGDTVIGGANTTGNSSGIIDIYNATDAAEPTIFQSFTYGGDDATYRSGSVAAASHDEILIKTSSGTFDSGFIDVWYFDETASGSGGGSPVNTIQGTYIGDGSDPQTISLPIACSAIIVTTDDDTGGTVEALLSVGIKGAVSARFASPTGGGSGQTESGRTNLAADGLSFDVQGTGSLGNNASGRTYHYVGIPEVLSEGGSGSSEGTSFPGSPSTGDRFYRTDRSIEYFYDGTRWLSTQLLSYDQVGANAITSFTQNFLATFGDEVWLEDFRMSTFRNASGSFDFVISYRDSVNTDFPITNIDTSGDAASVWVEHVASINAALSGDARSLVFTANETGSGNHFYGYQITYRLIG